MKMARYEHDNEKLQPNDSLVTAGTSSLDDEATAYNEEVSLQQHQLSRKVQVPVEDDVPDDEVIEEIYQTKRTTSQHRRIWIWAGAGLALTAAVIVAAVLFTRSSSPPEPDSPAASHQESPGDTNAEVAPEIPQKKNGASDPAGNGAGTVGEDDPSTSWSEMEKLLRTYSSSNGAEFIDPDSYQSKALSWMESFPPRNTKTEGFSMTRSDHLLQRYALACVYYATNKVSNHYIESTHDVILRSWLDESGWLVNEDECTWKGVTCDDQGRVTELNLSNNILTGTFPHEVVYLRGSLTTLDLFNNMMYNVGDEGNGFLSQLTKLERLYLGETNFQYDGIPPQLATLTSMQELDLGYTLYFGPMRGYVFGAMTNLTYLMLSGNSFTTSAVDVGTTLSSLPHLRYLYLEYADLAGSLEEVLFPAPSEGTTVKAWPSIYELWLDRNPELTGNIPTRLGELKTLASLSVTSCDISGNLPDQLGNLTSMRQMFWFNNSLTGEIPASLANLKQLETLELEMNDLVGAMPQEVCYLRLAQLQNLEADCEESLVSAASTEGEGSSVPTPEVQCNSVQANCCTCCGHQCAFLQHKNRRELRHEEE